MTHSVQTVAPAAGWAARGIYQAEEKHMKLGMGTAALTALLLGSLALPLSAQEVGDFTPITDEMLANPDPADWIHWRGNQSHWGYSPLDQITAENVGNLTLAWTRSLAPGDMEGTPLV